MLNNTTSIPPDFRHKVILNDGRETSIRPICYTDKYEILALFNRLSPETRFLRYHYAKPGLSDVELDYFCNVDYHDTFGLVAEMQRGSNMDIVGVGRYNRLPCHNIAEIAFVVEDKEQGNGIGTKLMEILADLASKRGIKTFVAELLNENTIMMDILRKHDPDLERDIDGSSHHITLHV
ncbi:GNAT family N-acetyltransferase [Chloroflexota bacterium]